MLFIDHSVEIFSFDKIKENTLNDMLRGRRENVFIFEMNLKKKSFILQLIFVVLIGEDQCELNEDPRLVCCVSMNEKEKMN